eukprot:1276026-Rhodomonas_salina.1
MALHAGFDPVVPVGAVESKPCSQFWVLWLAIGEEGPQIYIIHLKTNARYPQCPAFTSSQALTLGAADIVSRAKSQRYCDPPPSFSPVAQTRSECHSLGCLNCGLWDPGSGICDRFELRSDVCWLNRAASRPL